MDLFGNLEKILKAFISFVPVSSIGLCDFCCYCTKHLTINSQIIRNYTIVA